MSTVGAWISIIGSIASIASAVWACTEARKSFRAASKAEKVKDEIVSRRKLAEVSQAYTETSKILKKISTVGPSCNPSLLRGVNCALIAKEVEEYSRYINENSSLFNETLENKARELCQNLRHDIESLSEARSFEEKKEAGKSIYYKIDSFMPFVKEISDERKENVKTT